MSQSRSIQVSPQNTAAKAVRSPRFRPRLVKPKRGKGSYSRKRKAEE